VAELTLPDGRRAFAPSAEDAAAVYREVFDSDDYGVVSDIADRWPLIVDVGANVGLFILYAKLAKPHSTVHAFEPIPEIYDACERNVRTWGLRDVTVHPLAVGGEAGEAVFTYFPHQPADSTRYPDDKRVQQEYVRTHEGPATAGRLFTSRPVDVRMTTLGEFHETVLAGRHIDLLKVDVEGSELDVLRGMSAAVWDGVDRMVLEVHDVDGRLDAVCALLREHRFDLRVTEASELPREYGLSVVTASRVTGGV
jgi:FkbM family methyltransferase